MRYIVGPLAAVIIIALVALASYACWPGYDDDDSAGDPDVGSYDNSDTTTPEYIQYETVEVTLPDTGGVRI